jgi:type IV secretory pathway TrbL component
LAILFFLFVGWFGFIAWNYQEKHPEVWNFVKKLPFISETTPASPK